MSKNRKLKLNKEYTPLPTHEGDEIIYPNGIFKFNITRIMEHIHSGKLDAEQEQIHITNSACDCS